LGTLLGHSRWSFPSRNNHFI